MSKKSSNPNPSVVQEAEVIEIPGPPPAPRRMEEVDRLALELAKANRKTALAEAQAAVAKSETAEVLYKNTILQIYMKYGLTVNDAINEGGEILINGAIQQG